MEKFVGSNFTSKTIFITESKLLANILDTINWRIDEWRVDLFFILQTNQCSFDINLSIKDIQV